MRNNKKRVEIIGIFLFFNFLSFNNSQIISETQLQPPTTIRSLITTITTLTTLETKERLLSDLQEPDNHEHDHEHNNNNNNNNNELDCHHDSHLCQPPTPHPSPREAHPFYLQPSVRPTHTPKITPPEKPHHLFASQDYVFQRFSFFFFLFLTNL